jgi:hypothetical protein
VGWAYYISAACARVLAQVVPLLLFTVMYGSLTFLKSTVLRIAIPFDQHIILHLHVAAVFVVALVGHLIGTVLLGFSDSFLDYWGWSSGFVGLGLAVGTITAGLIYWISLHSKTGLFKFFTFPIFIWLHRLGYIMILVQYPIHIFISLDTNPAGYFITYFVFLCFILEVLWRLFHCAKTSECRMRTISPEFYWLEVTVPAARRREYRSGQWVYLTVPQISMLERHPFTIASVFERRQEQLSGEFAKGGLSVNNGVNNNNEENEALLADAFATSSASNLRFLIKKTDVRKERSWTSRLYNRLLNGEPVSVYVDGPFSSPAMNITPKTVKRAVLIGVGSGITAPLGIAAGLSSWTTLVFATREPFAMCQVIRAVDSIVERDDTCLRGGVFIYLTKKNFQWPHFVLLDELPKVIAGKIHWDTLLKVYEEYITLARYMFSNQEVPHYDNMETFESFLAALQKWSEHNDFNHPSDRVTVRMGRPNWDPLLQELQQNATQEPDTLSFMPESLQVQSLDEATNVLLELHTLYCGSRTVLADIRNCIDQNNRSLYSHQENRMHMILHEEIF